MNQVDYDNSSDIMLWEMCYEPNDAACKHKLPADWIFGGATEEDPRTDPRWQPLTFVYLDRMLHKVRMTQVPRCFHEAIGSHKDLIEQQTGRKVFYITGTLPGGSAETIYADVDGALNAS